MKKTYNTGLVKALARKYKVTPRYIRYCLSGERNPVYADELVAEYYQKIEKIKRALDSD